MTEKYDVEIGGKVLVTHNYIEHIAEITAIMVLKLAGEPRYQLVYRNCRGEEVRLWRRRDQLKQLALGGGNYPSGSNLSRAAVLYANLPLPRRATHTG